jgi:hypothetical protein
LVRPWYTQAIATGKLGWSAVYTFATTGGQTGAGVTICGPWYQTGTTTLLGAVGVDIDSTNLNPILQQYVSATTQIAYIVETSSYMLVATSTG